MKWLRDKVAITLSFFREQDCQTKIEENISDTKNQENIGPTNPKIINLPQQNLMASEIKILQYGLKFTPTPKFKTIDLIRDTEEF